MEICEICKEGVDERVFAPLECGLGLVCRKCFKTVDITYSEVQPETLKLIEKLFSIKLKFDLNGRKLLYKFPEGMDNEAKEWIRNSIIKNREDIIEAIRENQVLVHSISELLNTRCISCNKSNWRKINGRWVCSYCNSVEPQRREKEIPF